MKNQKPGHRAGLLSSSKYGKLKMDAFDDLAALITSGDLSPLDLASGAMYFARDQHSRRFKRWRELFEKIDLLRGFRDPLADQNVNLDILLYSFEDVFQKRIENGLSFSEDTAGLQFHIHLSRLWVIGAYESVRSLHQHFRQNNSEVAHCLIDTVQKGCGLPSCLFCSIGHLKNELALVRTVIAKGQPAVSIDNPPLTLGDKECLSSLADYGQPPPNDYLITGEGMGVGGVVQWRVHDKRIEKQRTISRQELSNSILALNF
ncbi:MAG: hypothetical protein AAFR98_04070 [Pseudomonadota bacterium]